MFTIEEIDPIEFRKKTRHSTYKIMSIFAVLGFAGAYTSISLFREYSSSPVVLNLLGALAGLILTFWIVKTFFADKPWMKEAMYSWRLKRSLAELYNVLETLKMRAKNEDEDAMKLLRYYHLAIEQMYQLENNSHGSIELLAEKKEHEEKMLALGLELNQIEYLPGSTQAYKDK